jgi:outer membrane protein OmpA-like peptidoglycan-associated protein
VPTGAVPTAEGGWVIEANGGNPCDASYQQKERFKSTLGGSAAGAAIGGLAGFVLGHLTGSADNAKRGAIAGAAIGGVVGGIKSYTMADDALRRLCDLQRVAEAHGAQAAFVSLADARNKDELQGEIAATVDTGHFVAGTARLTAQGERYYRDTAKAYTDAAQAKGYESYVRSAAEASTTKPIGAASAGPSTDERARLTRAWASQRIVLTGHTDDEGSPEALQRLSEARALAVAEIFAAAGVPRERLFYQGAGSAFPIAPNQTPEGRALNRRVEVVVLYSDEALRQYSERRDPNPEFIRPTTSESASKPTQTVTAQAGSGPRPSPQRKADSQATTQERSASETSPNQTADRSRIPRSQGQPSQQPKGQQPSSPSQAADTKPSQPSVASASTRSAKGSGSSPSGPSAISKPSPGIPATAPRSQSAPEFDLGGTPVATHQPRLAQLVGKIEPRSDGFSLAWIFGVKPAAATVLETAVYAGCHRDDPLRYEPGAIRRLTGEPVDFTKRRPSEYLPGLHGTTWASAVNDHLLVLRGIQVLNDQQVLAAPPLDVYLDQRKKADPDAKPSLSLEPIGASVFSGSDGRLYRAYFREGHQVRCMDIVFSRVPIASSRFAGTVYSKRGEAFIVESRFEAGQ